MSGRDYKPTLDIMLKGWLEGLSFKAGKKMNVRCEEGKLTITLKNETIIE